MTGCGCRWRQLAFAAARRAGRLPASCGRRAARCPRRLCGWRSRTCPSSSIYRTPAERARAGRRYASPGPGGIARFELSEALTGEHHHLTCAHCGTMEVLLLAAGVEDGLARGSRCAALRPVRGRLAPCRADRALRRRRIGQLHDRQLRSPALPRQRRGLPGPWPPPPHPAFCAAAARLRGAAGSRQPCTQLAGLVPAPAPQLYQQRDGSLSLSDLATSFLAPRRVA
jgi:hypothetical protein